MSIQELSLKLKGLFTNTENLLALLIIVTALISFWLGRMSVAQNVSEIAQKAEVSGVEQNQVQKDETSTTAEATLEEVGGYVASKSGTKYHLPWCGSAKQIKEENKIWFSTKGEAEKAGYTPASNCKGI